MSTNSHHLSLPLAPEQDSCRGGRTELGQGLRKHLLSSSEGWLQLGSGPQCPAAVRPDCLLQLRSAACAFKIIFAAFHQCLLVARAK